MCCPGVTMRWGICDLPAKPYLTRGLLVLSGVHLLASVHPTRAIYQPLTPQGRLMVAPYCAYASMGIMCECSEVCNLFLSSYLVRQWNPIVMAVALLCFCCVSLWCKLVPGRLFAPLWWHQWRKWFQSEHTLMLLAHVLRSSFCAHKFFRLFCIRPCQISCIALAAGRQIFIYTEECLLLCMLVVWFVTNHSHCSHNPALNV
jgi:hypothetical protein